MESIADKPDIVKADMMALQKHIDLDKSNRNCQFGSGQRHTDRLIRDYRLGKSPWKYHLPILIGQFTGEEDEDFHEDLHKATKYSIYQSAWTTILNGG